MFHTVLSFYDVFYSNNDKALRQSRMIDGVLTDTVSFGGREYVERIHSTNPKDYLNPNLAPFTEHEISPRE